MATWETKDRNKGFGMRAHLFIEARNTNKETCLIIFRRGNLK